MFLRPQFLHWEGPWEPKAHVKPDEHTAISVLNHEELTISSQFTASLHLNINIHSI